MRGGATRAPSQSQSSTCWASPTASPSKCRAKASGYCPVPARRPAHRLRTAVGGCRRPASPPRPPLKRPTADYKEPRPCCLRPCWQGPRSAGTIWPGVARCEGPLSAGESGGPLQGCTAGEGGWPGLVLHVPRARAGTAQGGGPAGARARLRLHHLRRIASTRPVAGAGGGGGWGQRVRSLLLMPRSR